MNNSNTHDQRIAKMTFGSVYPHYVEKVQKKGRTIEELNRVIEWLTGFDSKRLQELIGEKATFETFFQYAGSTPMRTSSLELSAGIVSRRSRIL